MCIDIGTYRARIGHFHDRSLRLPSIKPFDTFELVLWLAMLLSTSGDIELNPGPGPRSPTSSASSDSDCLPNLSMFNQHLSFVHYNVQSLRPKIDQLYAELSHFDVIGFSETWLSESTPTKDILFDNYLSPFRKDRRGDSHGGVIIYVKNNLPVKRRHDLEPTGIECIWLEFRLNNKPVLFGLFYRPPNAHADVLDNIQTSIDLAYDTNIENIIISGDLNLNQLAGPTTQKLENIIRPYNMSQIIREPTHFTENSSSLIDIICVSRPDNVLLSGVGEAFLNLIHRYHCPTFLLLNLKKPKCSSFMRTIWQYNRADYDGMRQAMTDTDWDQLFTADINTCATNVTDKILQLTSEFVPQKLIRVKHDDPPWLTTNIKKLIRKRKRARSKAKKTDRPDDWTLYRRLRNDCTDALRRSKHSYYELLSNKLKSGDISSKDWWKTFKHFLNPSSDSSIPPLSHNDNLITDATDKANLFNDYFQSQTELDESASTLPTTPPYVGPTLSDISLTVDEVRDVINSLPLGKASGPDLINNKILKENAVPLSIPLCKLFNKSLHESCFPDIWKQANVTPVYKKDDPSLTNNYRPISLLSTVGKLLEKLVHKHLYNFFLDNNVISSFQSGFIRGDSTTYQLTDLYNTFCRALDAGKEVRAVFCDISKAFDRVWHKGLLYKLTRVGISDTLLSWFTSYLSDRRQRVVLPGASSHWVSINAGVPQGSILGPLLFLVFINDIVTVTRSPIRLFADDTSLYIIVDNPTDAAHQLNTDLQAIHDWASDWLVTFNPKKTESILFSRKLNKPLHPPLFMNNTQISEIESHKHLGLYFSSSCNWHAHVDYIATKATQRVNIMRKFKYILDRKSLEAMYFIFIRPILEYADVVWDNCSLLDTTKLDKIQHEAARIAIGATKLISIEELYKETRWERLTERRRKHKLIMMYKMTHNLSPPYLSDLVPARFDDNARYNLRNPDNLQSVRCKTSLYKDSFLPSVVTEWNNLPSAWRNTDSIGGFKRLINNNSPSKQPDFFFSGTRFSQIHHARLRTKSAALNGFLFRRNLVISPNCPCGALEDTEHFLLHCPRFTHLRQNLLEVASRHHTIITVPLLLEGDPNASPDVNLELFSAVQEYIVLSGRFRPAQ